MGPNGVYILVVFPVGFPDLRLMIQSVGSMFVDSLLPLWVPKSIGAPFRWIRSKLRYWPRFSSKVSLSSIFLVPWCGSRRLFHCVRSIVIIGGLSVFLLRLLGVFSFLPIQ